MSALSLRKHFASLKDPRIHRRKRHLLIDIILTAICAVICGCDTWQEIALFGRYRRTWLKKFLRLPNGIPSHDTFERVFDRLDPQAFQACFRDWLQAFQTLLPNPHIAIDGKTLCSSSDCRTALGPLHLVSAWASEQHLTLGQVAVADKSNEITAIPKLLQLLELQGALVTLDAMGCQKEIAQTIVAAGGDYVMTVKDNQPGLRDDIQASLGKALDEDAAALDHYATEETGHGRHESRSYTILRDPPGLRQRQAWAGLQVIGMCTSERTVAGQTSSELRYFIGSKKANAKYYAKALRSHWRIENNLHWQLDVTFKEDDSRTQRRNAAENLALLRRLALSLLKHNPEKLSIACKRKAAALDPDFLEATLRGSPILEKV
jgi:predicted transposase YbfD/YdcC